MARRRRIRRVRYVPRPRKNPGGGDLLLLAGLGVLAFLVWRKMKSAAARPAVLPAASVGPVTAALRAQYEWRKAWPSGQVCVDKTSGATVGNEKCIAGLELAGLGGGVLASKGGLGSLG